MSGAATIVTEIEVHVISAGMQGPQGRPGEIGPAGGAAFTKVAGVALGGNRVVILDDDGFAVYASNDQPVHAYKVLGVTMGAASQWTDVTILRSGEMTEPSWDWVLDQPVFLSTNGLLTQTPPATGFSLVVGFPATPTKLFVSFREPLFLA